VAPKALRRSSDRKKRIVQAIASSPVQSEVLSDREQLRTFLRQYVADVPFEDLDGRSPRIMARIGISHLEFGARRRHGQYKLRIYNPTEEEHGYTSAYTFIEMVNDDMPFLVNSVSAAINRHGLTVHITVHPIIRVCRDSQGRLQRIAAPGSGEGRRESYIRFAVDRETGAGVLKALQQDIRHVLADVRLAVRDWEKMRSRMLEAKSAMDSVPARGGETLRQESQAFLQWLVDDHFTFLGYRQYRLADSDGKTLLTPVTQSALGVLSRKKRPGHAIELTPEMRRLSRSRDWLVVTKANSRSSVHRHAYLDYIGVKIHDDDGNVCGEHRFLGLFASAAYSEAPRTIPLLRHKIEQVFARTHMEPVGHRGKALLHIINTYPRDELFHASIRDLARTTIGILNLQDRQRVRFFLRRDAFRRFFSCLVYVPRDKYTTRVRRRIEAVLMEAFAGKSFESSVQIADSALARVHIIVHTPTGDRPRISIRSVEQRIAEVVVTWSDRLREDLAAAFGSERGPTLFRKYMDVFPMGYQEDVSPHEACSDVGRIEDMLETGDLRTVEFYRPEGGAADALHFVVYSFDEPMVLSAAYPILEDMGVDVQSEHPHELDLDSGRSFWIQDFHLHYPDGAALDVKEVAGCFERCFMAVLEGKAESDGLNRQVLSARLNWRETSLLRCYTKYLLQLGMPFSQAYMEDVLVKHAGFVRLLIQLFRTHFDPSIRPAARARELESLAPAVKRAVSRASNVDEDRILSAFYGAVAATLRTNYFQLGPDGESKPSIAIKLDPSKLREVPLPKPKFEIFVYSPDVEGVHLRGGDIARGGLRWSDRREDFRTEVLGLMKAQVVKNTVIVPTGAKGGFIPKRPPSGDRDARMQNGIECYKTFVRGLLDITDNVVDGEVVTPAGVVRRDGDDPYLVVAADKGTATFSDIANSISAEYGFWLDDAFASGGSAGYDHKKMGITAKGAWEAVKRHFREMGVNVQTDPFTVIGIGDMAGDVFGNGMLLSPKIQLVAAFNHQHIFLDPNPDIDASFRERKRLFRLPRSSWEDYDTSVISRGGGIYSRQAKTIRLSREVRQLLGSDAKSLQPDQLIRAILRMPADLLWNGGIGTYVKSSGEGHSDVGDRSNDSVRINANQLRCKVVGEGGNLGLTQRARIEYSLGGGRINTDFIDNSGGVDSSDREVNIKILLSDVVKGTNMTREQRNELLASMTDDVAELVLRNNYLQTQAISMSQVRSVQRVDEMARLITSLEQKGLLDRELEFLPVDTEIEDRQLRKQGFTRPELAVILSYAKIDLYNGLIGSGESLDDFLVVDPLRYFPPLLRKHFAAYRAGHRLSREILATLIANDLVNRMGPSFITRLQADTEADVVTIARAYTIARQICEAGPLLRSIEELDYKLDAQTQMMLMFEISRSLRHASYWLIDRFGTKLDIAATVERLQAAMQAVYTRTGGILSTAARIRHENARRMHLENGVPEKLADRMSALLLTRPALDMADLAAMYKPDVIDIAKMYAVTNERLGIYWLHECAEDLTFEHRWQAVARGRLRDDFFWMRRDLAVQVLKQRGKRNLDEALDRWLEGRKDRVRRFKGTLDEMKLRSEIDFATLSVAAAELRDLISD
jgi:glutamate dehydrogenase